MEFTLNYEGVEGEIQAELRTDDELIATGGGLQSVEDVEAWAQTQAEAHKNAVEPTNPKVITGTKTITLP